MLFNKSVSAAVLLLSVSLATLAAGCNSESNSSPNSSPSSSPSDIPSTSTEPVDPSNTAVSAAGTIQNDFPGATVSFSGNTGRIAWITSPGLSDIQQGVTPAPLAESRGISESAQSSSLLEFMERYKNAFGLTSAVNELQIARDPLNDPQRPPTESQDRDLGSAAGLKIRTLLRTYKGVRVYGQFANGVFDGQGNLQGVVTRILPIADDVNTIPSLAKSGALSVARNARFKTKTATYSPDAHLTFVDGTFNPLALLDEHTEELVLLPVDRTTGRLGSPTGDVDYRLIYDVRMRSGADLGRAWIDAQTGAVVDYRSDNQFAWSNEGDNKAAIANDDLNNSQLFLSAFFNDTWYMGISGKNFVSDWLASGQFVSVDNLFTASNRNKYYATPMTVAGTVNGAFNTWNNDTGFNATTATAIRNRQATHFLANLTKAEDWWSSHGWKGWDNQGSSFYLAIGMKKSSGSSEDLNAWGGNGGLGIGGGTTATGQYCGSSMEIVGHEYTHNFISATSALEYHDEPGAVNEALADIFGKAITAKNDAFTGSTIGGDIGWQLRDMVDPTLIGQPDRYSTYVNTTSDNNGVHTNSGIINKAHSLLVMGGDFNGITPGKIGMTEVEKILRLANVYKSFPVTASMEEFANGVLDMCHLTDAINQVFGDKKYVPICKAFRRAYQAVEVLPRDRLIRIKPDYVVALAGTLKVGASNKGYSSTDLSKAKITLIDDSGNETLGHISQILSDSQTNTLEPGDRVKFMVELPESFKTGSNKNTRGIRVRVDVDGDNVPSDKSYLKAIPTVVGADFNPISAAAIFNQDQTVSYSVKIENHKKTGYPAGLSAVMLTRAGATDTLTPATVLVRGAEQSLVLPLEGSLPADVASGEPVSIALGTGNSNISLSTIQLRSGSEIPGMPGRYQVWFNSDGGLPELNDHTQAYVLLDSGNITTEFDKTNNLVCVNCRVPGQPARDPNGVIVRLPYNVSIEKMFPAQYQAAAAKLKASFRIPFEIKTILAPVLNYKPVFNLGN